MEGRLDSITDKKTIISTRAHDQRDSGLCWDYAAASSVRKSLRIKLGKTSFFKYLHVIEFLSFTTRI